jgi:hypothetical protein
MASWGCLRCRTVYAVGLPACPQCGYGGGHAEGGVTVMAGDEAYYVAEGETPPAGLPPEWRLIGPGAPGAAGPDEPETEAVPDPGPDGPATTPGPDSAPPASSPASSGPGDRPRRGGSRPGTKVTP